MTLPGWLAAAAVAWGVAGCSKKPVPAPAHAPGESGASAQTNRVDIPAPVRQNLGIVFAKVERRNVSRTLRVPGAFELLPTARREYRAAVPGRVELLAAQHQSVPAGTPLYRIDSPAWRELNEQIAGAQARVDSMGPLREAHRLHERSLGDKVALWRDRLKQLEALREAGGGSASQMTEAKSALNQTQAELADVMEKDAELGAQQKLAEAELRSLQSRREGLRRGAACTERGDGGFVVCASAPGVVEGLAVTQGGLAEENGLVLTVVQPELLRFRARALQADIVRLAGVTAARVVPGQGEDGQGAMEGPLTLGPTADAESRTIDAFVTPKSIAPWARAGVAAHLEVVTAGGTEELAIPLSAVARDGGRPVIFRRDPANPDKAIRLEADLGISDGRFVVIASGVKEGDEVVTGGSYQLMLATSGTAAKGGHFHSDGTFHEGGH